MPTGSRSHEGPGRLSTVRAYHHRVAFGRSASMYAGRRIGTRVGLAASAALARAYVRTCPRSATTRKSASSDSTATVREIRPTNSRRTSRPRRLKSTSTERPSGLCGWFSTLSMEISLSFSRSISCRLTPSGVSTRIPCGVSRTSGRNRNRDDTSCSPSSDTTTVLDREDPVKVQLRPAAHLDQIREVLPVDRRDVGLDPAFIGVVVGRSGLRIVRMSPHRLVAVHHDDRVRSDTPVAVVVAGLGVDGQEVDLTPRVVELEPVGRLGSTVTRRQRSECGSR